MPISAALRGLMVLGLGMSAAQAANITIVPTDAPGEGFFDPTPFTPEGGNNATTLGQARLNVFRAAAEHWGSVVASNVEIEVEASFAPAPETECSPSSGTLGAAGPGNFIAGFRGAPQANTFYPVALANALAGEDLDPGFADIVANFNGAVDTDPNCLTGVRFYYGFDHQGGSRAVDFYNTVMHEIGHGLGFTTLVAND
ncbi:MAG: PA domain-containing protein, partial [Algiphilus sp.]